MFFAWPRISIMERQTKSGVGGKKVFTFRLFPHFLITQEAALVLSQTTDL